MQCVLAQCSGDHRRLWLFRDSLQNKMSHRFDVHEKEPEIESASPRVPRAADMEAVGRQVGKHAMPEPPSSSVAAADLVEWLLI